MIHDDFSLRSPPAQVQQEVQITPSGLANPPRTRQDEDMKKLLLALLILIVLIVAGGYYAAYNTPLPFKAIAWAMKKAGIETDGIEGNLKTGFKVGSLDFSGVSVGYHLKGLVFSYDSSALIVGGKDSVINDVGLKDISISLKAPIQSSGKEGAEKAKGEAPPVMPKPHGAGPIQTVLVKKIHIDHGELHLAGQDRPHILKSFLAEDVKLTDTGVTVKSAKLAIPGMSISIPSFSIGADQAIKMEAPADYHALLKQDLPLKVKVTMNSAPAKSFPYDVALDLSGLDGHVKGQMDPSGALLLEFTDLESNGVFKLSPEFGKLNVKMKVPDFKGSLNLLSEVTGSLQIHQMPFELVRLDGQNGQKPMVMAVNIKNGIQAGISVSDLMEAPKPAEGAQPVATTFTMMIRDQAGKLKKVEDHVAQWLFKKPLKKLKAPEQKELKDVMAQFNFQIAG